jgi:hypothetical protein
MCILPNSFTAVFTCSCVTLSDVHTPLSITFESNVFEDSDSDTYAFENTEHIVKIKW